MAQFWKRKWAKTILVLVALACGASLIAGHVRSVANRSEVAKLTQKMKTVCLGRVLVDVPARAEVSLAGESLDGFDIAAFEESAAEFRRRVGEREIEIQASADRAEGKGPGGVIEARDLHVEGMQGRVVTFGRDHASGIENGQRVISEWFAVEAHAHVGGVSFTLSTNHARDADALHAEELLARLRLRGEDELPTVPGFCSWRAVFAEPLTDHKGGHTRMSIRLPEYPELAVVLASFPGGRGSESLLDRAAKTDAEAGTIETLLVSKMRSGKRSIHGISGEEVLERVRELNFAATYGFMWEASGIKNDPLQPFLSLELQSGISFRPGGKPVDSTLHSDAVLALWDSISSSIRLRDTHAPQLARR